MADVAPLIVFVTAYDEHAIRAFDAGALDYLLKPVERERFATMMERVRQRVATASGDEMRQHLQAVLRLVGTGAPAATAPARVAVGTRDRTTLLDPAAIDRVDAEGNLIHVLAGRERFSFRETLTAFADRLPPGMFVRVNRATLVNVARVRHVEPWFNGDYVLQLVDGSKVTSGRAYRDGLRQVLGLR
jgi:two-component system LytT family response regulator